MNIILIGFMACGKSSLGRYMSSRTNRQLLDLDTMIEEKAQMPIPQIFESVGEKAFRDLESYVVELMLHQRNCIIATGGGCILRQRNREMLRRAGMVVWLNTTPENVVKFSAKRNNRPLLEGKKNLDHIKNMMELREPF